MVRLISVVSLLLATTNVAAERPPWSLTYPERFQARASQREASNGVAVVLAGDEKPGMFLPGELMALFLSNTGGAGNATAARMRARYGESLGGFSWAPDAFWRDLDQTAATYHELTAANPDPSWEASRQICAARIAALTTMRIRYARFDEFLYTAVAPRHRLVVQHGRSDEWLLWLEKGCSLLQRRHGSSGR